MTYEKLMSEYPTVNFIELKIMPNKLSGLYFDNQIFIDKFKSNYEKHGILAEELGHLETTFGDILDQTKLRNRQLENIARRWGYKKVVSLDKIIECYRIGNTTLYDMCTHLEITPIFLKESIDFYKARYGISKEHGKYLIQFEPLNVQKVN